AVHAVRGRRDGLAGVDLAALLRRAVAVRLAQRLARTVGADLILLAVGGLRAHARHGDAGLRGRVAMVVVPAIGIGLALRGGRAAVRRRRGGAGTDMIGAELAVGTVARGGAVVDRGDARFPVAVRSVVTAIGGEDAAREGQQ